MFNGKMYDQVDGVAMGSPLGPVLANIFMCHIESNALRDFSEAKPNLYFRFVDDVFLAFTCRNDMLQFFNWMNVQHSNIKFTLEEEVNNKLSFLDVLVTRDDQGTLNTSVYRKATFSGLYLQWSSFVPKRFKRGLVIGLVSRAWRLCSSYESFHQEIMFLRNVLQCNGYPVNFINSCINHFLNKSYNEVNQEPVFGPDRKQIFLCLPFTGINSDKLRRQLERLSSAVAPWVKLFVAFKPALKLSCLCNLKSKFNVLVNSGVVYKLNCNDCEEFYIGMTMRRLGQRMKEHSEDTYSAVFRHVLDENHSFNFDAPMILARDNRKSRVLIKESLLIRDQQAYASLNGNNGSTILSLW